MNLTSNLHRNPAERHDGISRSARWPRGEGRGEVGSFLKSQWCFLGLLLFVGCAPKLLASENLTVLKSDSFSHYIGRFNSMEDENVTNAVSNADSWRWLQTEIPFFEYPDREVEEIYYYHWWSFRKHLVKTPDGFVITEFLTPVRHAGIYNTISCAAGFHIAEGRWLRDQTYLDGYISFWLRGNPIRNGPRPIRRATARIYRRRNPRDSASW